MLQTYCLTLVTAALAFGCSSVNAQKTDDASGSQPTTPAKAAASQPAQPKAKEAPPAAKPDPTAAAAAAPAASAAAATLHPALVKAIGEDILKTIASAEKVTFVDVSSMKSEAPRTIQGHPVKGDEVNLAPETVKKLKSILLDKVSHRIGMRARCRFRPRHAFVFHHGEKTTSVLYASKGNCPKWSFPGTPKRSIIDVKKSVSKGMKVLLQEIRGEKK